MSLDSLTYSSYKGWHGGSNNILGVSGTPIDYSLQGDDFIIISLIVCTILTLLIWIFTRDLLSYQLYNILDIPREGSARLRNSIHQKKPLRYYTLQFCFLAAMMIYIFLTQVFGITFPMPSWGIVPIFFTVMILAVFGYNIIHAIPHAVYFDRKQLSLYDTEHSTFMAFYGIILLPFTIFTVFFGKDILTIGKTLLFCLCIVKFIEIYKVYSIFFRKNGRYVQFFLYLCTLEAVPILLIAGILALTTLSLSSAL